MSELPEGFEEFRRKYFHGVDQSTDTYRWLLDFYRAGMKAQAEKAAWQPIETAPKGGGAELVTDPKWIDPPPILLLFEDGSISVSYWDWYYAEGGRGYEGGEAWIEPISGERLDMHYDAPIGWMPLPSADAIRKASEQIQQEN